MTGQTGQTGQQAGGGVLGSILARFASPQPPVPPSPPVAVGPTGMPKPFPVTAEPWDEARALEVQSAVRARLDAAVVAMPANHPTRAARLNVLANECGIIASLIAKRDPILWGWLKSLERLLEQLMDDNYISRSTTIESPDLV